MGQPRGFNAVEIVQTFEALRQVLRASTTLVVSAVVKFEPCMYVGRKEMFYVTTHSTHFIYGYMAFRHMVKDRHIGYSFRLTARVVVICTIPQTG